MACQADVKIFNRLLRLNTQLMNTNLNIYFNKTCKRLNIIPNYINIQIKSNSIAAIKAKRGAETIWINSEIKFLYSKKVVIIKEIDNLMNNLSQNYNKTQLISFNEHVLQKLQPQKNEKWQKINNKINILISKQKPKSHSSNLQTYQPRITNLTSINFNKTENNLLNKGSKFNTYQPFNFQSIKKQLIECESVINYMQPQNKNQTRLNIINITDKNYNNNPNKTLKQNNLFKKQNNIINSITNKLKNNKAEIVPVDKSNAVVIAYSNQIHDKVLDFIYNNNIQILTNNPTDMYIKNINNLIKNSKEIIPKNQKIFLLKQNHKITAPQLHPFIKLHKKDHPIRPLINFKTAPSYNLAKYLDSIIKEKLNIHNYTTILNTYDFIEKINNITIEPNYSYKMISLDVKNLYTSIPKQDAINILENKLSLSKKFNTISIQEIIQSIKEITNQNYFQYNNKLYSQKEGFVMGSPLSALLSEIYMQHYETNNILNNKNYKQNIKAYFRYVDDTFILFRGSDRQAINMVNSLNKINKHIQFTLETQINNKINFLDLTITIINNKFNFNIYRKPTQTDAIIPFDSNHPYNQKISYFNALFYRLERIPLNKTNYQNELNIIYDIAIRNKFNLETIKKIHKNIKNKIVNNASSPINNFKYCSMKYQNNLSNKLAKIMNNNTNNIRVAFKTSNNLMKQINYKIKNTTKTTPSFKNAGVYKLNCSCNKFYIGKTNRDFNTRYKEHISEIKLKKKTPNSNFAKHVLENKHKINFDINKDLEILNTQNNIYINSILEELHIHNEIKENNFNNILNVQTDFKNNIIYQYILDNNK